MKPTVPTPRGRHAPPLEVRLHIQRRRLLDAGAELVDLCNADTVGRITAEAVSRHAGMSKATFYEHFSDIGEFRRELAEDLRRLGADGGLHSVQHAAAMCDLLVPDRVARKLAEHLQQLGWTGPQLEGGFA